MSGDKKRVWQDKELNTLVLKWRERLWLNQWRIWASFVDTVIDSETKKEDTKTVGISKHYADYRELFISMKRSAWEGYSKQRKNQLVAHEMIHGLLAPLREFIFQLLEKPPKNQDQIDVYYDWFHKVDEHLTTHLTDVFLDAAEELDLKGVQKD